MRVLRLVPVLSFACLLASCDKPPTAIDEAPQLMKASEDNMVVPWFYWEGPQWVPCANDGAGAEFWWSAEVAGFGKEHVTPSGNYQQVLTVKFRDVELRDPSGELYPFRKVEQVNVTHDWDNGHSALLVLDNEFYSTPDGRNVMWQAQWHLNLGVDGPPTVERFTTHCSPAKW